MLRRWIWIAPLVLLGGAVLWLARTDGLRRADRAAPPHVQASSRDSPAELADGSVRDPVSRPVAHEPSHEVPGSGTPEPVATGSITGMVLGRDREPLSRHRVGFREAGDPHGGQRLQTLSDGLGQYTLERIPVGEWSALHLGDARDDWSRNAETLVGTVHVVESRVTVFDVVLPGDRCLSGAITLADDPLAALQLELRSCEDPGSLVAAGWASPEPDDGPPSPEEERRDERDTRSEEPTERRPAGGFRFCGLAPGCYSLRVILGKEVSTGEIHYLERELDLSEGDVSLEPIAYRPADFFRATLQRRGTQPASGR